MKVLAITILFAILAFASAKTVYTTVFFTTHVYGSFSGETSLARSSPQQAAQKSHGGDLSQGAPCPYQKTAGEGSSGTVDPSSPVAAAPSSVASSNTVAVSSPITSKPSQTTEESKVTGDIYADIANSPGLNESWAKGMLDFHNSVRKVHQVGPLRWNRTVWEYAQKHADKYPCHGLKHTGGIYGECLFAPLRDPSIAAPGWYSEEPDWKYGENGTQYSHFSQMVWKKTTDIGCATHYCADSNAYYVICNYWESGNMLGSQALNVFPPIKSLQSELHSTTHKWW